MAIAFDNSTASLEFGAGSTSGTLSYTCSGTNRYLIVVICQSGISVSGITYNGVAMTQLLTSGGTRTSMWGLANPSTGANNIIASVSSGGVPWGFLASSYTGCSITQPDSSNNIDATYPNTVTTNVVASNCWLVCGALSITTGTLTSNRTDRQTFINSSIRRYSLADSNGTVGTGNQSIIWTCSSGANIEPCLISLAPFSAPSNTSNFFNFF